MRCSFCMAYTAPGQSGYTCFASYILTVSKWYFGCRQSYISAFSRSCVAHCTFEITLLQAIMLTLLLVCAFSPKVHSIFWGPLFAMTDNYPQLARGANITPKAYHCVSNITPQAYYTAKATRCPFREILTSLQRNSSEWHKVRCTE